MGIITTGIALTARYSSASRTIEYPFTSPVFVFGVARTTAGNAAITALKKACDRHRDPTPERGYWAKPEHGKRVKKEPLETQAGMVSQIERRSRHAMHCQIVLRCTENAPVRGKFSPQ